ncbi:MAG TPA: GatB/YqeY domain-containing protein, partial [Paracoccus sp. (in: a-proteobacteria)]|nr:GatB/YqeY domain-containing protein [Paracoccus sp. (in: a-proteobacteria)]
MGAGLAIRNIGRRQRHARTEADDAKVGSILTKMVKQRKDSAQIYADAGRQDLADKEHAEIEVLNRYMPQML